MTLPEAADFLGLTRQGFFTERLRHKKIKKRFRESDGVACLLRSDVERILEIRRTRKRGQ